MDRTSDLLISAARNLFEREFGRRAEIVAAAPGRVNLIGGHVDYNDGIVLPLAIDQYTVIAGAANDSGVANIYSRLTKDRLRVDLCQSIQRSTRDWENYVLGVLAGLSGAGCPLPGFDAAICSGIQPGAGLSSSAALEVAIATFVNDLADLQLPKLELALLCQQAEHRFANVPCGTMDQFTSVHGKPGYLIALDCRSLDYQYLPWPEDIASILVINSHAPHRLVDGEYAKRKQQCKSALSKLSLPSFRDLDKQQLARASSQLTPVEFKRASHVVSELARCQIAIEAIRRADLELAGRQLLASHVSLRDNYEVSCAELDRLVEAGEDMGVDEGIFGIRMTGAGFGGSVVAIVANDRVQHVAESICAQYARISGRQPTWFATLPSAGAEVIDGRRR